jgi:hypothetical protein
VVVQHEEQVLAQYLRVLAPSSYFHYLSLSVTDFKGFLRFFNEASVSEQWFVDVIDPLSTTEQKFIISILALETFLEESVQIDLLDGGSQAYWKSLLVTLQLSIQFSCQFRDLLLVFSCFIFEVLSVWEC